MATHHKATRWERWINETVLADITSGSTPDPVPMLDTAGPDLEMTDAYDAYRLGRGSGDYLYLLYLLNEPVDGPIDIIPVYIGETSNIAGRLLDHFRKLRDALPIDEWVDDGSWGSFGKYDHIATVYDRADSALYAWVVDVTDLETGPYGFPTYRQELEAKTVGHAHSHPQFERVLANRDFVPNRVAHEMGKAGPDWVDFENESMTPAAELAAHTSSREPGGTTKTELWHDWVAETICQDIHATDAADPVPLFETDQDLLVQTKESGSRTVLERSAAIDERIRQEGRNCVHRDGVRDGAEGLLYVMYQLDGDGTSPEHIRPRYIGKAEAYGKKNELSANFEEIAKERAGTRSFARWGDGKYWHVGELSDTVFGVDDKKTSWASSLFEQGTHRLEEQTYLWNRAWDPKRYPGPYGHPAYLAEVEALLIGLAYDAYPEQLLNHNEVPAQAPANATKFAFQPVSE